MFRKSRTERSQCATSAAQFINNNQNASEWHNKKAFTLFQKIMSSNLNDAIVIAQMVKLSVKTMYYPELVKWCKCMGNKEFGFECVQQPL